MRYYDISFNEFISKFRNAFLDENSELVLNVKKLETGYFCTVFARGCYYDVWITAKELGQFYSTDKFDDEALFRMFKDDFLDKIRTVYVNT